MKLKYYLRGVGAGILFATIILSVSYQVSSKARLSDAEIIKRAEKLGMVKQSDINMDDLIAPSATPAAESTKGTASTPTPESTKEPTVTPTPESAKEPTVTSTPESMKKPTGTPIPESAKVAGESHNTSATVPEADKEPDNKSVSFEIAGGMTSEDVSNLLRKEGIIEDAKAFNQYLILNHYTTDINIGKYQIEKHAPYEDIANAIVTK